MTSKKKKRSSTKKPRKSARRSNLSKLKLHPKILIFDIDGVLIDVRATYWRSAIETVRHLSGKRVTYADLHKWKAKPGHNDDWRMTANRHHMMKRARRSKSSIGAPTIDLATYTTRSS